MRAFFLLFCLFPFSSYSQTILDFGAITGQDISTCKTKTDGKICKSKNDLEISLTRTWLLVGSYETVTIIYNDSKWKAYKYEGDLIHDTVVKFIVTPVSSFEKIFSDLKSNGVFILPNQNELKYKGSVDDGTEYILTFKAGTRFRSYRFENPDIYLEDNKDMTEFQKYVKISELFFSQFKKE